MFERRLNVGFLSIAIALLFLSSQGCLPPNLGGEWKDYEKRWHVCFEDVIIGRRISIDHKFLYPTLFATGTKLDIRGDFDALNTGDQLPNFVTWKFEHRRKGNLLFEQEFPVTLNQAGAFPRFGVQLTGPIEFKKNDVVKLSYTGINFPHDADMRLKINFPD